MAGTGSPVDRVHNDRYLLTDYIMTYIPVDRLHNDSFSVVRKQEIKVFLFLSTFTGYTDCPVSIQNQAVFSEFLLSAILPGLCVGVGVGGGGGQWPDVGVWVGGWGVGGTGQCGSSSV